MTARASICGLLLIALVAAAAFSGCDAARPLGTRTVLPSDGTEKSVAWNAVPSTHHAEVPATTGSDADEAEAVEHQAEQIDPDAYELAEDLGSCFEGTALQGESPESRETRCHRMLREDYGSPSRNSNPKRGH